MLQSLIKCHEVMQEDIKMENIVIDQILNLLLQISYACLGQNWLYY